MTARQTINLNNVIVHLALAISRQFGACQYRHVRFDRNTPLDCNTALEEIGYAIDLFKKIPNKLVIYKSEYLEYMRDPCVWNIQYTISKLANCIANEEEIASTIEWMEDYGIRHSIRETN